MKVRPTASQRGFDLVPAILQGFLMVDIKQFESIKHKHGGYASWAVWADAAKNPKSNIGNMSIFDFDSNPGLLPVLKTNIIMVGLNISRLFSEPLRNFHDPNPRAHDFKLRYAFQNTAYYGAYMTDVIKNLVMIDSNHVLRSLKEYPALVIQNISTLREELHDLDCRVPIILAFGAGAYTILRENLDRCEYSALIRLIHYSYRIGEDKYREVVLGQISEALT